MKLINCTIMCLFAILLLLGCSESIEDKKQRLSQLKEQVNVLESELKTEVSIDETPVLVTKYVVTPELFEYKIELRGNLVSENNTRVSSRVGGKLKKIIKDEGDRVIKGETVMIFDTEEIDNQIEEVKKQLELATSIDEKRDALWKKNIGTEVQYLEAKNRKESLEKSLNTLETKRDYFVVTAPLGGIIDQTPFNEGEFVGVGMSLFTLVNNEKIKIVVRVPESYQGKVKEGDPTTIYIPSLEKKIPSKISKIGRIINQGDRTFEITAMLPRSGRKLGLSDNQEGFLILTIYKKAEALLLPTRIVGSDSKGNHVFKLKERSGKYYAESVPVKLGRSYKGKTEIQEGLRADDEIVNRGFRDVSSGVLLELSK